MLGVLSAFAERCLIGACFVSGILLCLSLAASFRLLPALLSVLRRGLGFGLALSVRLYAPVLARLAPWAARSLGVDLLGGATRPLATLTLSLGLGLLLLALGQVTVVAWHIGLLALHGLVVGFLWDDLLAPGELRLGVRLP